MFSSIQSLTNRYQKNGKKLATIVSAIALSIFVWFSPLLGTFGTEAHAATATGVADRIEGAVDKNVGQAKQNFGKVSGQTEGALQEAKGNIEEGVGTAKNKLDEAGDNIEDTSESLIDSVKDFFD